jgi:hypothetical protein
MHPTTKESGIKTNHINFKGKKNLTNTVIPRKGIV